MKTYNLTKLALKNPENLIKSKKIISLERKNLVVGNLTFSPVKTLSSNRDHKATGLDELNLDHILSMNTERFDRDQLTLSDLSQSDIRNIHLNKFKSNEDDLVITNYLENKKKSKRKKQNQKKKYDIKPLKIKFPRLALQLEKLENYNVKAEKRIKKFKNDIIKIDLKLSNKQSNDYRNLGRNITTQTNIKSCRTEEGNKIYFSKFSSLPKLKFNKTSSQGPKTVFNNKIKPFGETLGKMEQINKKIKQFSVMKKDGNMVLSSVLEKCEKIEKFNSICNEKLKSI